jgi:putative pyruvate formate lyase activating enzyme
VDRLAGERGACRSGPEAAVASWGPHFGEERPLVGSRGSGTVFFAGCNLACVYCQNFDISRLGQGRAVDAAHLAQIFLAQKSRGCANINLVSPTHHVPAILCALAAAAQGGLDIPLVYNTGGYESPAVLALLDGVVDIYMPDMKYASPEAGLRLSGVPDYPAVNQAAVAEMHRQVGDLRIVDGLAVQGLLVRHLVLPGGLAGTARVAQFLADEVSRETAINLMRQYRPCYLAQRHPPLDRAVTDAEWREALRDVAAAGLRPMPW